ncbi:MAG: hypothetical protein OEY35_04435, partial [Gammaproteobacteria bacterium]|nr:hypothetical protein [Gammaproteobacteria bacterium]
MMNITHAGENLKVLVMKKFLMLLICVFSLSSLVQAEEKPENSSTATIDRVLAMLFHGTKPDRVGE